MLIFLVLSGMTTPETNIFLQFYIKLYDKWIYFYDHQMDLRVTIFLVCLFIYYKNREKINPPLYNFWIESSISFKMAIARRRKMELEFKIQYKEWLMWCSLLYVMYLSAWYVFLSHIDYWFNYRMYQVFWIRDIHVSYKIVRKITFRRFFKTADLRWYILGYEGKIVVSEWDKVLFFFIFMFFLWNIYYILTSIFFELDTIAENVRSSFFLIIFLYFATFVGNDYLIMRQYVWYCMYGLYCWGALFWIPVIAAATNATEDYSDEDEEIDFYNFTQEQPRDETYMEDTFGGTEITDMFWSSAKVVHEYLIWIIDKTDIYHLFLASDKERYHLWRANQIRWKMMERFYMSKKDFSANKIKRIRYIHPKKLRSNIRMLERRKGSLDWRLVVLRDTLPVRIMIWIYKYTFIRGLRSIQEILNYNYKTNFTYIDHRNKYFLRFVKRKGFYKKYGYDFFFRDTTDYEYRLEKWPITFLDKEIFYAREHRSLHEGIHGLNKVFLLERLLEMKERYDPALDIIKPEEIKLIGLRNRLDYELSKLMYIMASVHDQGMFFPEDSYRHPKLRDGRYSMFKRNYYRFDHGVVFRMLLFGAFINRTAFLTRTNVYLQHIKWRLNDFEGFLHPTLTILWTMIDDKYETLTTWEKFYSKDSKLTIYNETEFLNLIQDTYFTNSMRVQLGPKTYKHWDWHYFGETPEDSIYEYGVTKIIEFNTKERFYMKKFGILHILRLPFIRWFYYFRYLRFKVHKLTSWPRAAEGPYEYIGPSEWRQTFFLRNISNMRIMLRDMNDYDYYADYCRFPNYLYKNKKKFEKWKNLALYHNFHMRRLRVVYESHKIAKKYFLRNFGYKPITYSKTFTLSGALGNIWRFFYNWIFLNIFWYIKNIFVNGISRFLYSLNEFLMTLRSTSFYRSRLFLNRRYALNRNSYQLVINSGLPWRSRLFTLDVIFQGMTSITKRFKGTYTFVRLNKAYRISRFIRFIALIFSRFIRYDELGQEVGTNIRPFIAPAPRYYGKFLYYKSNIVYKFRKRRVLKLWEKTFFYSNLEKKKFVFVNRSFWFKTRGRKLDYPPLNNLIKWNFFFVVFFLRYMEPFEPEIIRLVNTKRNHFWQRRYFFKVERFTEEFDESKLSKKELEILEQLEGRSLFNYDFRIREEKERLDLMLAMRDKVRRQPFEKGLWVRNLIQPLDQSNYNRISIQHFIDIKLAFVSFLLKKSKLKKRASIFKIIKAKLYDCERDRRRKKLILSEALRRGSMYKKSILLYYLIAYGRIVPDKIVLNVPDPLVEYFFHPSGQVQVDVTHFLPKGYKNIIHVRQLKSIEEYCLKTSDELEEIYVNLVSEKLVNSDIYLGARYKEKDLEYMYNRKKVHDSFFEDDEMLVSYGFWDEVYVSKVNATIVKRELEAKMKQAEKNAKWQREQDELHQLSLNQNPWSTFWRELMEDIEADDLRHTRVEI